MSDTRTKQFATIISTTEVGPTDAKQLSAIISITEMPSTRVKQAAIVYSVSPGLPRRYGATKVSGMGKGGMSLLIDMNANSKR